MPFHISQLIRDWTYAYANGSAYAQFSLFTCKSLNKHFHSTRQNGSETILNWWHLCVYVQLAHKSSPHAIFTKLREYFFIITIKTTRDASATISTTWRKIKFLIENDIFIPPVNRIWQTLMKLLAKLFQFNEQRMLILCFALMMIYILCNGLNHKVTW